MAHENQQQLVVIAYFIGFGSTQLVWGPLADRFGRKPILAAGVILYSLFALLCGLAWSFPLLIAARVCQGAAAAVTRVLVVAMVRDLFESEEMARVMSLVSMVFMVMPVVAPNLGQLILLIGSWRAIFAVLAAYGVIMLIWSASGCRRRFTPNTAGRYSHRKSGGAIGASLTDPLSRGYTMALTVSSGCLIAYISSVQQIVADAFHEGRYIGLVFAAVAAPMALASWTNSRVVGRFGLRRIGHLAAAAFARHRIDPCSARTCRRRDPVELHRPSGADDVLLRLHLGQPQHAGDDQHGGDRRHRLVGAGSRLDHRRRGDRFPHRPASSTGSVMPVPARHRSLRRRRIYRGRTDRAEAAVRGVSRANRPPSSRTEDLRPHARLRQAPSPVRER